MPRQMKEETFRHENDEELMRLIHIKWLESSVIQPEPHQGLFISIEESRVYS